MSGSTYSTNLLVPSTSFTLTGNNPKSFTTAGGSGKTLTLAFCPDCGVYMYSTGETYAGIHVVKAGTLDDTKLLDGMKPFGEIQLRTKVGWVPRLAEQGFEGNPGEEEETGKGEGA